MADTIIIGIDAGTSIIKSVAFDAGGRQIASVALPNTYEILPGGGAEQDLGRTWADTAASLRQLAEKVPDLARRTVAVAVTGQGDGTWLIDGEGEPVGPAWLWLDARAAPTVEEIRASPDDRARFEKTATGLAACQQGAQLAHIGRHMPERLKGAATAFHCKDWLYFKLTGSRATDPSEGCFTFGDFRRRAYDDEVVGLLGLEGMRSLLPPIVDGTRQNAGLSPEAAAATGLKAGTPVALGYIDVVCTALGAGLFDRRATPGCTIIGSTGMNMRLVLSADQVELNDDATGYTMCMPAPGVFAQMQSSLAATLNIDWVLSLASDILRTQGIERGHDDLIGLIDGWVAAASPGALLYQPYISEASERGPFVDGNARAGFVGLSQQHGFGDLVRSVLEGLAFAVRDCYAAMGPLPQEIRLTGGAAKSPALRAMLGAVLGARTRTSRRVEAGAAGAAMIAAVSTGHYASMDECAAEWVDPMLGEAEDPDTALAQQYGRVFDAYVEARTALRPVWRSLAGARKSI